MIIAEKLPTIVFGNSCPLVPIKVLGQQGNTLYVASYDILSKQLIGERTYTIDSDPWENLIVVPTPEISNDTIIHVYIAVKDSNGKPLEVINTTFYFAVNFESIPYEKPTSAWYITKFGFAYKRVWKSTETFQLENIFIPSSELVYTVLHEEGRLRLYEGNKLLLDVRGDSAIFTLKFKISKSLAYALANYIDDDEVLEIIYKVPELAPLIGGIKAIERIYEDKRFTPLAVAVSSDENYVYYDVTTHVDLHTPIDVWNVVRIIIGIGSIVAGAILLVASAGVSAPASTMLIASGISAVLAGAYTLYTTFEESPTKVVEQAQSNVDEAKRQIDKTIADLEAYLNQLVQQGKITEDEKNKILEYVYKIRGIAFKTFDELIEAVKKAYKEGYNKCKEEMWKWIAGSGVGGFIVGLIIGKR